MYIRRIQKYLITLNAVWITVITVALFSYFDGAIRPVVTELRDVEFIEGSDGWTRVVGKYEKLRNCVPVRVQWYYQNNISLPTQVRQRNETAFNDARSIIDFDPGIYTTQNLYVFIDADSLENDSHAIVFHKCYGDFLWETRSKYYTSG